jgi:hypothetical protein
MKSMKKTISAITLVIVGLVIISTTSASVQIPKNGNKILKVETLNLEYSTLKAPTRNIIEKQPSNSGSSYPLTATLLWTGATHNAVDNQLNTVVCGFSLPNDETNPGPFFTASSDGGVTFLEQAAGWVYEEPVPDFPEIDSCHDGKFIGSMVPGSGDTRGFVYKMECSNPTDTTNGYALANWDLTDLPSPPDTYHFTNIPSESVGGYAEANPAYQDFAYGGTSVVCDYQLNDGPITYGIPVLVYSSDASNGWIHWFSSVNGSDFTRMNIDPITKKSYTVCNELTNGKLFYYKMNFGTWNANMQHTSAGSGHITTSVAVRNVNFDVAAYNNSVIVISQRSNGDVVAYVSSNGLSSVTEVAIATSASNPKVEYTDNKVAKCSYVKQDGSLYFRETSNGGITWTTEAKVNEPENANIPSGYGVSDICGIGGTWWSSSGGEDTLYFAPIGAIPTLPNLNITSVTGGVWKVSATIKNSGTANATIVDWTIHVTGGILGLIDKTTNGTIDTLAIGEEKTITSDKIIFGFGAISVTVTAICDEGASDTQNAAGKKIFVFLII